MDDAKLNALGETIVAALPGAALGHSVAFNQLAITVDLSKIVDVMRVLKTDPRFRFVNFTDVTAVDYPGRENRFNVVYHLMSPVLNTRIRLSGEANETTQVPSIIGVFPGADWFERETYDLYGVIRSSDMRRLLTDSWLTVIMRRISRRQDQDSPHDAENVRAGAAQSEFRKLISLAMEGADYALPGDEKASPRAPAAPNSP